MLLSLNHNIDTAFITQSNSKISIVKFKRIDADVEEALKEDEDAEDEETVKDSD